MSESDDKAGHENEPLPAARVDLRRVWFLLAGIVVASVIGRSGCSTRPAAPDASPKTASGPVDPCRETRECHELGLCTSKDGFCTALNDAECDQSRGCERFGACVARAARCVGSPRPTCRSSGTERIDWCRTAECESFGPICAKPLTSDEACRAPRPNGVPSACDSDGLCVLRDGVCAAATDEHCRSSAACKSRGHCVARGGQCVAERPDACAAAPACKTRGECSRGANFCYAADTDCASMPDCKTRGERCAALNGSCQPQGYVTF